MSDHASSLTPQASLPLVACLCPTYGRFSLLREALACFLAQDYPNKQLIILNDAELPIGLFEGVKSGYGLDEQGTAPYEALADVHIINVLPFTNLGAKRQALLEQAVPFCNQADGAELPRYCAHWDDDDLYLPWHLSMCVQTLEEGARYGPPQTCVKPHGAWYMPDAEVHGIHHNMFEGQIVFQRERALELGGYPQKHSGQAADLMRKFNEADEFWQFEPSPGPSYVYRWGQGIGHISSLGDPKKGFLEGKNLSARWKFQRSNTDFGDGQPLTPADLTPRWTAVLESARKELSNDAYEAFEERLNRCASAMPSQI